MLEEIQQFMTALHSEPEQFKGRVIFVSMLDDIVWGERGITDTCARRFLRGRWSFWGPGSEKKWCGTLLDKPNGDCDRTAARMMLNFAETCHPVFRATSALERGGLRSKEKGKKCIHFNGSEEAIELILRPMISVDQYLRGSSRFVQRIIQRRRGCRETKIWNQWKDLQNFLLLILTPTRSCRDTCCKIMSINSNNFLKIRNCPDWTVLHYTGLGCEGVSALIKNVTVSKSWSNPCFETGTVSWVRIVNGTETSETISLEKR